MVMVSDPFSPVSDSVTQVTTEREVFAMAPDHYEATLSRIADTVDTLRGLGVPAELVHCLSVEHWTTGTVVMIHIDGTTGETVSLVDRIADHYALPAEADPDSGNYARGGHLGQSPVHVFCGRPETSGAIH
jgi:hypothetical protein